MGGDEHMRVSKQLRGHSDEHTRQAQRTCRRLRVPLLLVACIVSMAFAPSTANAALTLTVSDPVEDVSAVWTVGGIPSDTRSVRVYLRSDTNASCREIIGNEIAASTHSETLSKREVAGTTTPSYTATRTGDTAGTYRFCLYAAPVYNYDIKSTDVFDAAHMGQVDITVRTPNSSLTAGFPNTSIIAPDEGASTVLTPLSVSLVSEAPRRLFIKAGHDDRGCGPTFDTDAGGIGRITAYDGEPVTGTVTKSYDLHVSPEGPFGRYTYCIWLAESSKDTKPLQTFRVTLDVIDPKNPTGAPLCTVPAVKGMTATQAIGAIVKAGCAFPTVKVTNSQAVKPGQALKLNHVSGASIPNITPLVLHMRRARICTVPKLKGATLAQARIRAVASGCKVGKVTRKAVKGVAVGQVASVKPGVGKQLKYGSKLTLVVRK